MGAIAPGSRAFIPACYNAQTLGLHFYPAYISSEEQAHAIRKRDRRDPGRRAPARDLRKNRTEAGISAALLQDAGGQARRDRSSIANERRSDGRRRSFHDRKRTDRPGGERHQLFHVLRDVSYGVAAALRSGEGSGAETNRGLRKRGGGWQRQGAVP